MTIAEFQDRVARTMRERGMIRPGARIGIAVSGGGDSIALLDCLAFLGNAWNLELVVLHVNHKLRSVESDDDARFVETVAGRFGLPYRQTELPVDTRENVEQAARNARYRWLYRQRSDLALDRIAVGHTRSDQAETVLFRFLRGSGTAGLAGIWPCTEEGLIRPLIELSRSEVRNYLGLRKLEWREDSSNQSEEFARNRIRLGLFPQLQREWNPNLEQTLAVAAECARAEEEFWTAEIDRIARDVLRPMGERTVVADCAGISSLPVAVARRVLRRAVQTARGDLRAIDFAHIEGIRNLVSSPEGSGRLQVPGVDVLRSFDLIRFAPPETYRKGRHFSAPATIPGRIQLPDGFSTLVLRIQDLESRYNEDDVNCLDWERLPDPLEVRSWQPGDQYRQRGQLAAVRVKTLFQEFRIPIWERQTWPVLASGESVVWARQFGPAAEFAATGSTRRIVVVDEERCNLEMRNQKP